MQQNSRLRKRRSQEEPRNVPKCRKNCKSNKDFSCQLKTPMINIAKVAKITNLTKFKTQKEKKPRRASKCPQMLQNRKKKEDFCRQLKPLRTNIAEITNKSEFLQIGTILVVIDVAMKFLFLLQILRNWRTTRGPSLPLFCC